MRLLIVGSRSIREFDLSKYVSPETDLIISGGASGIDQIAEAFADQNRISKLILRPSYDRYGKAAPIRRNEQMVDLADSVLVIWDGSSRGTRHTAEYARRKGKELRIVLA